MVLFSMAIPVPKAGFWYESKAVWVAFRFSEFPFYRETIEIPID